MENIGGHIKLKIYYQLKLGNAVYICNNIGNKCWRVMHTPLWNWVGTALRDNIKDRIYNSFREKNKQ